MGQFCSGGNTGALAAFMTLFLTVSWSMGYLGQFFL